MSSLTDGNIFRIESAVKNFESVSDMELRLKDKSRQRCMMSASEIIDSIV